uniref:Uncharacterized protein n=1 Tax=viral metagenome TaxID=1070528 RepID=A0A6M3LYN6_9ZZZZ
MDGLRLLEKTAVPRILVLLLNGKLSRRDFKINVQGGYKTTRKALSVLLEAGLISETQESRHPYRLWTELTPKGYSVARLLDILDVEIRRVIVE